MTSRCRSVRFHHSCLRSEQTLRYTLQLQSPLQSPPGVTFFGTLPKVTPLFGFWYLPSGFPLQALFKNKSNACEFSS